MHQAAGSSRSHSQQPRNTEHNYRIQNTPTSEVSVSERIFNVSINDVPVLENFDLARQYGAARAVVKKFVTLVSDGEGITVSFDRISGEPVLNAVRIYKNH